MEPLYHGIVRLFFKECIANVEEERVELVLPSDEFTQKLFLKIRDVDESQIIIKKVEDEYFIFCFNFSKSNSCNLNETEEIRFINEYKSNNNIYEAVAFFDESGGFAFKFSKRISLEKLKIALLRSEKSISIDKSGNQQSIIIKLDI